MKDTTFMPKENFNEKLIARLKTHPDFTDESDELLPTAVKDHAWQLDHNLIKLNRWIMLKASPFHVQKKIMKNKGNSNFIYCELMQFNQAYMDKIQAAQSSEELVALWQEIAENSFLNWYVNAETPQDAVDDFKAIDDLAAQKHCLVELLDKNQLYVNLSEIEDADFGVSEDDKDLNKAFYGDSL